MRLKYTFKHYCMLMRSLNIDQFYLTQEMRTDHLSLYMFITLSSVYILATKSKPSAGKCERGIENGPQCNRPKGESGTYSYILAIVSL